MGKRLRRAFSTWLAGQGFPEIPISPHVEYTHQDRRACLEARPGCGRFVLLDARLRTRVTYAQSSGRMTGWAVVTVEQHAGAPVEAYAPGFVPVYLATERITDGAVQLFAAAEESDEDGVVHLLAELARPRRRVPVVVVSADARHPQAARANAAYLAARVAGTAQVVWLADLRAQDRFNDGVGAECAVYGGGVRTYLAGWRPGEETYPDRHRVMGGRMLRDRGEAALDLAAGYIIGETAPQKLPDELREPYRLVGRILQGEIPPEALHAGAAVRPRPAPPPFADSELYRKMMALATAKSAEAGQAAEAVPRPRPAEPGPPPERPPAPPPAAQPALDLDLLAQTVADRVAERLAGLADTVAGTVGAGLHDELESMLELITADPQELVRQMRTMSSHVATLTHELKEAREGRRHADSRRDEAESETARLEDEVERLRRHQAGLERDLSEATARERRLAERVRRLEADLHARDRRTGDAGRAAAADPVPETPASLVDALYAAETLTHVVIGETTHEAGLLDLAYPGLRRVWAGKAWDALCALDDYAKARSGGEFQGGFRDWCLVGAAGRRVISAALLAMKESDSVSGREKFAAPRTFPVPPEVDPSGKVFMPAHIKLRKTGTPAPRIHFHDDAGGATGKVWVGYVGDHLPNTRTN
ncbi:hypothetical protein [Actinocorallia populi]|uniref:hypothetical protein n=1 Tax=Actinocorallia populi TaxID=2079200 RepID=UPI000D09009C|nr:hypothetical protein [Actinocorallia populi]